MTGCVCRHFWVPMKTGQKPVFLSPPLVIFKALPASHPTYPTEELGCHLMHFKGKAALSGHHAP